VTHGPSPDLHVLLYPAHEPLGALQHLSIRNPQQADADGSEVIFFSGVSLHLTWLRVNATIKLNGQAMFEAVEIDDAVLDAALAAKFRAQPPIPQEMRWRSFSFGLAMP
jgi:hypothetical protein